MNAPLEVKGDNYIVAVTNLELYNTVFFLTEQINFNSVHIPGYWHDG